MAAYLSGGIAHAAFFIIPPAGFVLSPHYLNIAILVLSIIMALLVLFIRLYMLYLRGLFRKEKKRKRLADLLVQRAIFSDEDDVSSGMLFYQGFALVRNAQFKKIITAEIILARKNIAGTSAHQLTKLYVSLSLHRHSLKKLTSRYWYIRAQGIQELAVMELTEYTDRIITLASDHNELVRMEAQTALVQLMGFEGLSFLNHINYPIADWQQIKLLKELAHLPVINLDSIDSWLGSANHCVIIFAMRIARNYHLFNLHDRIAGCLLHESPRVRMQAILAVGELYNEYTAGYLKSSYQHETLAHQLAIIKALQIIGTTDDLDFLLGQLNTSNYGLKLEVLRAIAAISSSEFHTLEHFTDVNDYPLADMIRQIKGEIAA